VPSKIRILDEQLTNMIAAGEVVERPASVVKELVENSLDAGAKRIRVETRAGGKSLIRVIDDGEGMNRDDLLLALERHATSKIRNSDDLFAIRSMGFRGEAVPAVASVSKTRIASKERGALSGHEVISEGGEVVKIQEAGLPVGTTIEVRSLFFNTPGRRKFLKTASTELSHVADAVTRLALANHQVHFELTDSDHAILRAPATPDPVERVASLLGKQTARSLIAVEGAPEGLTISGYVGSPELTRSNSGQIFFFVNGRYVRDRLVYAALRRAYEGHILKGRHPVVVLFLSIDPELVDVNVHPGKLEVRFRKGPKVYDGLVGAVQGALEARFGTAQRRTVFDPLPPTRETSEPAQWEKSEEGHQPSESPAASPRPESESNRELWPENTLHRATRFSELPENREKTTPAQGPFSRLEIVGQLLGSYIVCQSHESDGALILIDQHAAHERILFEKLSADYYNSTISAQSLLIPIVLELTHSDATVLDKVLSDLARAGVAVEPFGRGSYRVIALPAVMSEKQGHQLVLDCIERKKETGRAGAGGFADEMLELLACHSAVRAGQALTVSQMREILRGLDGCERPGSCPHGRPTTKEIPVMEIERFFGRR
jgi:DNA mismatch repair protein MutL